MVTTRVVDWKSKSSSAEARSFDWGFCNGVWSERSVAGNSEKKHLYLNGVFYCTVGYVPFLNFIAIVGVVGDLTSQERP